MEKNEKELIVQSYEDLKKRIYAFLQEKLAGTSKDNKKDVEAWVSSDREDLCEEAILTAAYMFGELIYVDIHYYGMTCHVPLSDIRIDWQVEIVKALSD